MKNLLFILVAIFFGVPAVADNYFINPGFELTPWDSAWSSSTEGSGASPPESTGSAHSGNTCCLLEEEVYTESPSDILEKKGWVWQEIAPLMACTISVWHKHVVLVDQTGLTGSNKARVTIEVKKNGSWTFEWYEDVAGAPTVGDSNKVWTQWGKRYGVGDTVTGIRFYARAFQWGGSKSKGYWYARAAIWVDDAYINGIPLGVEANAKCNHPDAKLEIYPNPFSRKTTIDIRLKTKDLNVGEESLVYLEIYDVAGRLVRSFNLTNPDKLGAPIAISWDGTDKNGKMVSAGIYFCRLSHMGGKELTKKLILASVSSH
ncbi:MAG: T9SS type A sorting domain-containing protein [bacterium]|nr:T9SS type A sorting domain-containing protein [bacterium]